MKKTEIVVLVIILISFIIGIYFYPQVPERFSSHWNANGKVNGYISKFWGLFLMPSISIFLFLLFEFIPKIDPLKQNVQKFRNYFDGFIVLTIMFLFYLHLLTIFWNLGFTFSIVQFLIPAFSIFLFYLGILLENTKRNWFIGIRTPWTLSSDKIWEKTHKLGGKLFKIIAIVVLIGILFEDFAFYLLITLMIFSVTYTVVYSYFEYKKRIRK